MALCAHRQSDGHSNNRRAGRGKLAGRDPTSCRKTIGGVHRPIGEGDRQERAARTRNADEFYKLLAAGIERESDRAAFLAGMRNEGTGNKGDAGYQKVRDQVREVLQNSDAEERLTPAVVQRAARLLGQYVGPLAGLFTKKAAQIADCERTLYLLLAEHVGDSERERFLREAGITL